MSLISSRLDFKSSLKGSICYHSESLKVLYLGLRAVSYSKQALVKLFSKYLTNFRFISTALNIFVKSDFNNKLWFLPEQSFGFLIHFFLFFLTIWFNYLNFKIFQNHRHSKVHENDNWLNAKSWQKSWADFVTREALL